MTAPSPTSDPEPTLHDTAAGRIALTREGPPSAPTIICLHGIPGSHRDFRYLAPLLAGTFQVVRVNAPGFALSPPGGRASVDGWADALWAVADALEVRRAVLLAHSFGGAAVLHAAARHPERTLGVALLASPGGRRHRAYGAPPAVYAAAARLARLPGTRAVLARLARRAYARRGLAAPAAGDWQTLAHQLAIVSTLRFERLTELARGLTCPALVAHCADDPLVEIDIARELAGAIRGAETLFFPGGGHHVQKHHAAEIAAALRARFAAQTDGDDRSVVDLGRP